MQKCNQQPAYFAIVVCCMKNSVMINNITIWLNVPLALQFSRVFNDCISLNEITDWSIYCWWHVTGDGNKTDNINCKLILTNEHVSLDISFTQHFSFISLKSLFVQNWHKIVNTMSTQDNHNFEIVGPTPKLKQNWFHSFHLTSFHICSSLKTHNPITCKSNVLVAWNVSHLPASA